MADGDFVVFDAQGNMLGNQTSNQGQTPLAQAFSDLETKSASMTGQPVTTAAASSITQGQSKFNGWLNYFSSQLTGKPSGNATAPGGTNPGATDSPASSDVIKKVTEIQKSFADWIPRLVCMLLGFIFVAVGLAMFGINTGPGQEIIRATRNAIPRP